MATTTKLTADDLDRALADERHWGFGYSEREYLSQTRRAQMDRAVLRRANTLGWDYEDLFAWTNNKAGRWSCDEATDKGRSATDIVNAYMVEGKVY
jgi:hypothetical protein